MNSSIPWLPSPSKDYNAAKRQYVEQYGSVLVMITYLKIALLALSAVVLGLVILDIRTYEAFRYVKPMVIRINEVGRAEALKYDDFQYQPQEGEIRYFLVDFIERHYSRMRATLRDNYARSLFFLDGRLADALIETNKKSNVIEAFLAGSGEEIEVKVTNVSIQDLRSAPYHATADFEKIYYASNTRDIIKREKYVANIVFVKKDRVPNEMIPVNPLGLTITYFHEYQAFQ